MKLNINPNSSATVHIHSIAQQKLEEGIKIFNLSVGEPQLPPHPLVVNAVMTALTEGKVLYPPVSGITELKKAVCHWMNEQYACTFNVNQTLVTNGAKLGIYLILQLLLKENDEVIVPSPFWVSYPKIIELFKGTPIIVNTKEQNGWKLTPATLEAACTKKSKILILNNACNPTGILYTHKELTELLNIAKAKKLFVLSDEVYSGLTYDKNSYISCGAFFENYQQMAIIQSCSKNFSMTGWRVGFVFSHPSLIKNLTALLSQSTSGVTTISQWAAITALREFDIIHTWVKKNMEFRRGLLIESFKKYFNVNLTPPASALYLFIPLNCLGIKNMKAADFCQSALLHANVALIPGCAFGKEGYIRISFATSEQDLTEGIKALANFCKNINEFRN